MTMLVPRVFLAAGFASLWMLAWIAAAGIPIAIHFFLRRQQTKVSWATIELLRKVIEQESKRLRFEQWLLLLIRTLILVLFGLALARPYLEALSSKSDPVAGTQAKLWVFVVDTSYTMAYGKNNSDEADESRWQQAIEKTKARIEESGPNDNFMLITLGKPSAAPIRKPTRESERIITELKRQQLPHQRADIPSGLTYVSSILEQTKQNPAAPKKIEVVLLSDFVGATWQPAFEQNENALVQLASKYPLKVIPLGNSRPTNLVLQDLQAESSHHLLGEEIRVTATIFNFNSRPESNVEVSISLNDQHITSEQLDIPAQSLGSVSFQLKAEDAGFNRITASLPQDNLTVDNQRHLVVEVRDNRRILFVESKKDETRMIRLALSAGDLLEGATRADVTILSPIDLLASNLTEWEVIVCNDLGYLDRPVFAQLQSFVERGGNLVIGLGPATTSAMWNSMDSETLLGFQLVQASAEKLWNIDPLEYQSSIAKPFQGFPDSGLLTTPIFRHWLIQNEHPGLRRDIGLVDSGPLVTRFQSGNGWVACLLSAPSTNDSSAESPWNAMATWPSFVPLMQGLMQSLLDSQLEDQNLACGDVLGGQVSSTTPSTAEVILPNGESKQLTTESLGDGGYGWFFYQTQTSGMYQVKAEHMGGDRLVPYSVNLEPITSRFASISLPKLPSIQPIESSANQPPGEPAMKASNHLIQGLLIAVLVLLLVESCIAWYFGQKIG